MATEPEMYRPIGQDELLELAKTSRSFSGFQFAPAVSFDESDFAGSQFNGCVFTVPSVRGADFSRSRFRNCKSEPTRFASCRFAFDGVQIGQIAALE